jgi:hypothetical protein
MLTIDQKQFELIRSITWEEVVSSWRNDEAQQQRWIDHYRSRGFDSWDEWRGRHVAPLGLDKREWFLYRIIDPLKSVPRFLGGPFKAWKKEHYGEKDTLTFAELAALPKIDGNKTITAMVNDFPPPTMLIGLWQTDKIIIGEGMHRCCALALAARRSQRIEPEVTIALADFSNDKISFIA